MDNIKDLISAIASGNAVAVENGFSAAMSDKLSTRLDDMRADVAQSMFAETEEITEEGKKPSLGTLAAKHFEHIINANHGGDFDLSDKQMASHAKKAHEVKSQIAQHHGAEAAKNTHEHSHMAADHEQGSIGGETGFHHEFVKKHLGGVNSPEHKKYKAQIDKQDLKMHGDTGVTSHHEDEQLDEISQDLVKKYYNKVSKKAVKKEFPTKDSKKDLPYHWQQNIAHGRLPANRKAGIGKALNRMASGPDYYNSTKAKGGNLK